MQYVVLGDTGMKVSLLCMGTMTFGNEADEAMSEKLYRRCREAGIDFFDCANVYGGGKSEQILGRFIKAERDKLVVTSKVYFKMGDGPVAAGYSRASIMHHLEQSLRRLNTEYLDLYFLHHFDENTPIEDALRTLDDLVKQGKIRYPAVSNFAAWQIAKALGVSARLGLSAFRCVQPMYNLIKRQAEVELLPLCKSEKLAVISYSPLAGGILTGKYGMKSREVDGRLKTNAAYQKRYASESDYRAAQSLAEIASELGHHPASVAVAWVAKHPAITSPIIGARNLEQLEPSLKAVDVPMTDDLYAKLSALTPAPPLPTDREEERA